MLKNYLSLIKFSHTIFAIPFALIGFTLAVSQKEYAFTWDKLLLVLLCMIFARSAAMAFNRYIDRDVDSANPRTAKIREIPNGAIKKESALRFVIVNCILFMGATYLLNSLCFLLSPIALLVILGYSYTKRFTALCHLILGLGLSLSPVGAYLGYYLCAARSKCRQTIKFTFHSGAFRSKKCFTILQIDALHCCYNHLIYRNQLLYYLYYILDCYLSFHRASYQPTSFGKTK